MKYRPEIDGLRALAVLPVVLFHAGISQFTGGYVGVDVFFVISGFLITTIIAAEIKTERFSLLGFYERRLRRIFPALLAMIGSVLIAGTLILLPSDLERLSESAVAAILSVSNFLFLFQSTYFGSDAEWKPLLHTWSLAIEEQFYLFFPPVLLILYRYAGSWRVPLIWSAVGLSLLLSIWAAFTIPSFAFYMLPTRAWELLLGSVLALGMVPGVSDWRLREALAALGIGMISFAVFVYSPQTPFPGAAALLPALGAALVIHCGASTFIGRALSTKAMVGVGLISYSLYLWHWPILVFARYHFVSGLGWRETIGALTITLAAAYLSFRFVEIPFRDRKRVPARRIVALAGASSAILLGAAAVGVAASGFPGRFGPEVQALAAADQDFSPRRADCHRHDLRERSLTGC